MSELNQNNADVLMADIENGPSLMRTLLIAVAVHVVVIGLTSIPYFMKVASYGTWNVRDAAQAELVEAERVAREQRITDRREKQETPPASKPKSITKKPAKSADSATERVAPSPGDVSRERPSESSLDVDADFGL